MTGALGVLDEDEFDRDVINYEIAIGDKICLCTDGVIEATNLAGELFGEARLEAFLVSSVQLNVAELERHIGEFCDGASQHDDLSIAFIHCQSNQSYHHHQNRLDPKPVFYQPTERNHLKRNHLDTPER